MTLPARGGSPPARASRDRSPTRAESASCVFSLAAGPPPGWRSQCARCLPPPSSALSAPHTLPASPALRPSPRLPVYYLPPPRSKLARPAPSHTRCSRTLWLRPPAHPLPHPLPTRCFSCCFSRCSACRHLRRLVQVPPRDPRRRDRFAGGARRGDRQHAAARGRRPRGAALPQGSEPHVRLLHLLPPPLPPPPPSSPPPLRRRRQHHHRHLSSSSHAPSLPA